MDDFWKVYDDLADEYHLYMNLKKVRGGLPRWRLQVFGFEGTLGRSGDSEIICVEAPERDGVFQKAAVLLKERSSSLKSIKEILEDKFRKKEEN